MRTALFLIAALLQVVCRDQEECTVFPRNPIVPYGSDITMFLRVPPSGDCHSKILFDPSRIFWTLNKKKIDGRFYDFNTTIASVSIYNLSVEEGTVECFLNAPTPVLLHGSKIRTYPLVSSPQNVSCIGKLYENAVSARVTCTWDHEHCTTDIKYTVYLQLDKTHRCESWKRICTFPDKITMFLDGQIRIHVIAQNPYNYSACSGSVFYQDIWDIVQMDSPGDVIVEPLPTGFRITWTVLEKHWISNEETECELQLREKGSYAEPVVISVENGTINSKEVNEVKPCTNYTISVRSRYHGSVWSTWSHEVTALSYSNVSRLPFRLWRSRSISGDEGKRTVHLMWKEVPPSCKAVDEYCIFSDSELFECFGPYQNHTFITLDEHPHRITVAAFRNDASVNDAFIEVPAMAEELDLPPVRNMSVFVQHGFANITWKKPILPVSGYIIVWNSTAINHMWQQTQKNNFTLMGEPSDVYTISLIPLYKDGPGNETIFHNCSHKRSLPAVSALQVIGFSDKHAEIRWWPLLPSQCCAFVLNYTVCYKSYPETQTRAVAVGPSQHSAILEDLQARTTYSVYVMASTATASSKSVPIIFSTKPSKFLPIFLILCSVALIVLTILVVMIQRKLSSKKIPDPRFSSLSVWPSKECRNLWSLFPVPADKDPEKILPCQVVSEVIGIAPTSKKVISAVKTLTDGQNIVTYETSQTPNTPLAARCFNEGLLINGSKEQRVPLVPSLDFQTSGISPQEFLLPHVPSPYMNQTPLSSPVQSPTKPPWSDDTETLLTLKPKNTTFFTSYLTLDMFDSGKHPAK